MLPGAPSKEASEVTLAEETPSSLEITCRGPMMIDVPTQVATFEEWDWHAQVMRSGRTVEPTGVVVVEGVCALHQMFRDDMAVRIWIDAPYDVRLERGVARDGEASRATWVDVWMPNEAAYVERDDPVACAHLVVDGTEPYT